jgi:hypothetical protein
MRPEMTLARELNFRCFNTRPNLPGEVGRKRGESNFLDVVTRVLPVAGSATRA